MKKIILWFFLFCIFSTSQSFAINTGTFWPASNGMTAIITSTGIVMKNSSWAIDSTAAFTGSLFSFSNFSTARALFLDWDPINANNFKLITSTGAVINSVGWNISLAGIWTCSNYWAYNYYSTWELVCKTSSNFYVWSRAWTGYNPPWYTYTSSWTLSWQIFYRTQILWPQQQCTTETIPDFSFINIHPTSSWAISEYLENPSENEFWYSTSLSWNNPLLVSLLWAESVSWFSNFSIQTWALSFKTQNSTLLSNDETYLALSSSANISYIKLLWSYWNVDIITYRDDSKTIKQTFTNIDLNSFSTWYGYPLGETPLVLIRFKNAFSTKTLNTLQVYWIWADQTKDVQICLNLNTQEYTIDGEEYTWNPYTDFVGTPEETEVTFTSSWYLFYENGFCLSNFRPFPSWWDLIFEIKNPLGELSDTYPLKNTWLYKYWDGTCTKITTNYHDIAWQYYVKAKYKYKNVLYPVHDNFFAYQISAPEFIDNTADIWNDTSAQCSETGMLSWFSNFFCKLDAVISTSSANISSFFSKITTFFQSIGDIGNTTEYKWFWFLFWIPQASADFSTDQILSIDTSWNTIFQKMKNFMTGILFFIFFIALVMALIFIKKKND